MRSKEVPLLHEYPKPNGFPTPMEEWKMHNDFSRWAKSDLPTLLSLMVPDWRPTASQTEILLATLYGIYFYDYVTGGAILSGYTTCNKEANEFRKKYLRHQNPVTPTKLPLVPQYLADWPISLVRGNGPECCYLNGIIEVEVDATPEVDPHSPYLWYAKPSIQQRLSCLITGQSKLSKAPYVYTSTYYDLHLLAGIEEAQHSHLGYLRQVHYEILGTQSPLKDLQSRPLLKARKPICDYYTAKYNGLLGEEFAAHIVQVEYIRRYIPDHLKKGYEQYDAFVRNTRRKRLGRG